MLKNRCSPKAQIRCASCANFHKHHKSSLAVMLSIPLELKGSTLLRMMRSRTVCNAGGKNMESLEFNIQFESRGRTLASNVSSNEKSHSEEGVSETNGSLYEDTDLLQSTKEISFPVFRLPPKRWIIVLLCFFAFLLCNMDRVRTIHFISCGEKNSKY